MSNLRMAWILSFENQMGPTGNIVADRYYIPAFFTEDRIVKNCSK